MISKIREDAARAPKTIVYKLNKRLATLSDEEEACTHPRWAYLFARDILGADIGKCQEATCKDLKCAYYFARYITVANNDAHKNASKDDKYNF